MKKLATLLTLSLSSAALADVVVKDAWIRPSTGPNGALFMEIANDSPNLEALVDAKTNGTRCDHMELHTHIHEDGKMMMRQVQSIEIPAHGKAELKPGGLHIMLMGLKKPLKEGEVVPVALKFQDGKSLDMSVPVKNPSSGASATH